MTLRNQKLFSYLISKFSNDLYYITKIADKHKRTIGAIKFKLIRHAIELIEKKELQPKLNDISEKTNLSTRDILEGFKKLKFEIRSPDK